MSLCPPVCLSVTIRCSIEMAERIELVFGMWASFHPPYTVLKGNSVISKNKGTSLWNFVLNSGLRKFRQGILIVETCYQLSEKGGRSERDKLGRRRSTKSIIPPSYDARPDRQALSTARFCRTGQLATADTWFRTCRTSSFCAVAWQFTRFQLKRRIARSLGDSWASCVQKLSSWGSCEHDAPY